MTVRYLVSDIDGTLTLYDDPKVRAECAKITTPQQWEQWQADPENLRCDSVNAPVRDLLLSLTGGMYPAYQVVLCTSRFEVCRRATEEWLRKNNVPHSRLYMRRNGDYRPDTETKLDALLDMVATYGKRPEFVLEDRSPMVKAWRSWGVPCWQVNDWNPASPIWAVEPGRMTIGALPRC